MRSLRTLSALGVLIFAGIQIHGLLDDPLFAMAAGLIALAPTLIVRAPAVKRPA